jgi:DNA replication and repair protein RecF
MAIFTLEIQHFRNLNNIQIKPQAGLNFIIGPNGSGKTSLLEAIHCLGRAKSFRTHKTNRLISEGMAAFTVLARIEQQGRQFTIGMQRRGGESTIRMDGKNIVRSSELTQALPIAVLEPSMHRLIEEGPENRRKFLDWGAFHVEHGFHRVWSQYRRALSQRNAALRSGGNKAAIVNWDHELVQCGKQLDATRRIYLKGLLEHVPAYSHRFPDIAEVEIKYQQGWREGEDFAEYLAAQFVSDRDRGFTQFGPHRADLRIRIGGIDAREFLSRGQQKVLVASLVLAQCEQMREQQTSVVVLVDDLPSELDEEKREILIQCLLDSGAQVFITGTEAALFKIKDTMPHVFHVKHGHVGGPG